MADIEHASNLALGGGGGLAVVALAVFVLAYALVIAEEFTQLRKSKPVVLAAGVIWVLVGVAVWVEVGGLVGVLVAVGVAAARALA